MNLVIVESPTKAKTISKFLGDGFDVDSSYGHVRDLPKSSMGVDVEHDFTPSYLIPSKARPHIKRLRQKAANADAVYLATDEDREGEAIAWHLAHALTEKQPTSAPEFQRLVFHEITERAIRDALHHPRAIDTNLVNAQQARRVLDRLVGYTLSPLLWRKVARGLSAGRVQSVAVRLIVDRERERSAFIPQTYWSVEASLRAESADHPTPVQAVLTERNGRRVEERDIASKEEADAILRDLHGASPWKVESVSGATQRRRPPAPFTTSTLQQDAARRLRYSAQRTMRLAQTLYETGFITYMRTDSTTVAEEALQAARSVITETLDPSYCPPQPQRYRTKQKRAQEAHEAIRPTDPAITSDRLLASIDDPSRRLYDLIRSRFLASQMSAAVLQKTAIRIAVSGSDRSYTFTARGQVVAFDGFTRIYPVATTETILPFLTEQQPLTLEKLEAVHHETQPPPRYSEASLVRALEYHGIGRPSTYAPIIATIQRRGYVRKERGFFAPTEIGTVVNDLLVRHFPSIVDVAFTATMEEDLDEIADGSKQWVPVVRTFYTPFAQRVEEKNKELRKQDIAIQETDEHCERCGKPMVIRLGRFGRFLACTGFPNCRNTKALNAGGASDATRADGSKADPAPATSADPCPLCGGALVRRHGRFGAFWGCAVYPKCKFTKRIKKDTPSDPTNADADAEPDDASTDAENV